MNDPRLITAAERAVRRSIPFANPGTPVMPIAGFKKKGCTTCKPIPIYARQNPDPQLPTDHANPPPTRPAQ